MQLRREANEKARETRNQKCSRRPGKKPRLPCVEATMAAGDRCAGDVGEKRHVVRRGMRQDMRRVSTTGQVVSDAQALVQEQRHLDAIGESLNSDFFDQIDDQDEHEDLDLINDPNDIDPSSDGQGRSGDQEAISAKSSVLPFHEYSLLKT